MLNYGSKLFNDIPNEMKDLNSVMIFKTRILEFCISQAFNYFKFYSGSAVFTLFRIFRFFSFLQGPSRYQHFMLKRSRWLKNIYYYYYYLL